MNWNGKEGGGVLLKTPEEEGDGLRNEKNWFAVYCIILGPETRVSVANCT